METVEELINNHIVIDSFFNLILDNSNDVFLFFVDRNVAAFNKRAKEVFGTSKNINSFVKTILSNNLHKKILPSKIKSANGGEITIEWEFIQNKSKKNISLLIGRDISEIEELSQKNFRLNYILKKIPGYVFWKNKNSVLMGCNEAFAKQVGLKRPEDIAGKTDYELPWTKEQTEAFLRDDKEVIQTGIGKINIEEPQRQIDNHDAILLTSKVPTYNREGKIDGILGMYVDITDRKRAEELQKQKDIAEKTANFANMLAGSIAHELRNPLAGINTQMDLLSLIMSPNKSIEDKENACLSAVSKVKKAIKKTTHIIDDILMKVRSYASGKVSGSFAITPIKDDVDDVLSSYPFQNNEKKLVVVDYKKHFEYRGDEILTRHVLSNLIKNSLHAILESSNKGKITIKFKSDDKFNYLIFRDTGNGIPRDFLPKIFDQFETKKSIHGGTGLGLAFCKMVMQSYNGYITCKSQQGKYTEFTLSFPKV